MNKMEFRQCSIGGVVYGQDNKKETLAMMTHYESACEFGFLNPYATEKMCFFDREMALDLNSSRSEIVIEFLIALAVCHTIPNPKRQKMGEAIDVYYAASSPDEQALVSAARDMGVVFLERSLSHLVIMVNRKRRVFQILQLLEFDSNRKRMSVIVKTEENEVVLYCKGADRYYVLYFILIFMKL